MGALVALNYGVLAAAALLLAYVYLGYPLIIWFCSSVRPRVPRKGAVQPTVSVVLTVWNEAERIVDKIENIRELEYPREKIQLIIVDDGSDDGTGAIVEKAVGADVTVVTLGTHQGKAAALNAAIEVATGEIAVFMDARQRIPSDGLEELLNCFFDDEVGAVSGSLSMGGQQGPGMYWRYERWIRGLESRFGSVVGVTGAFWAARRRLLQPLPVNLILDDLCQPMRIALSGYRVVLAPGALVWDNETNIEGEFARKVRTLAGNYQLVGLMPALLNPRMNPLFWQFLSHKLLRLLSPFLLALLFVSSVIACLSAGWAVGLPLVLTGLQVVFYGLAVWGLLRGSRAGRVSRFAATFTVMNAAAFVGWRRYMKGRLDWGRGGASSTAGG